MHVNTGMNRSCAVAIRLQLNVCKTNLELTIRYICECRAG